MPRPVDNMTSEHLCAVLEHLTEEAHAAETHDDLLAVMNIARELFAPIRMRSAIQGLPHIRAELDDSYAYSRPAQKERENKIVAHPTATASHLQSVQNNMACTVSLEVPQILQTMFQDLSQRMNRLQNEDPETFVSATSALCWLANGDIQPN